MQRSTARASISILFTAALGLVAGAASAHPGPQTHDAVHAVHAEADATPRARTPVVVYVNRGGGTVTAGDDDSTQGTSSLVEHGAVKVPAWKGGEARWKKVMACVRERFSPFDLEITEERPQDGHYIMAMVGGRPSLLGYESDVSGIAPYTGDVMADAIVYVFAAGVDNDPEITCVDVLHEVGHALGLDHEYLCQDPMSYLWDCEEPKTFQDADAACGEDETRACENGAKTQNSYRILAQNVGLRNAEPAPEPATTAPADPPADPPVDPLAEPAPDDASPDVDSTTATPALGVTLDGPSGIATGNGTVTVTVHGHGDQLTDAALAWLAPDGRYTLTCSAMPAGGAATCRRNGDDFVFRLEVGTGWRYFAAIVVDDAGETATSDPSSVFLQ